jgi:hypothetical protein
MAVVLKHVGDVASESTHSQSFHVPGSEQYIGLLEADPDLMKLVGESYTSGSYNAVRCLGKSFCMPIPYETSQSMLPEFFRTMVVSTSPHHVMPTYGQQKGTNRNNHFFTPSRVNASRRTIMGARILGKCGTGPMAPHFGTLWSPPQPRLLPLYCHCAVIGYGKVENLEKATL